MPRGADDVVSGAAWDALQHRFGVLREIVWNDERLDADTKAEGLRYLLRFFAAGIAVCMEYDDTEVPELGHMIHHRMTWGLDNPDCVYSYARVDGRNRYRITGSIGSARHLEFQVNTGHQSDGDFAGWQAVSAIPADDIESNDDGEFEIVLSTEPHGGNWLRLDESASFLLIRQYFCNWDDEEPARMIIEREGRSETPRSTNAERAAIQIGLLCDWLDRGARCWDGISRGILGSPPADIVPFLPPAEASGLKGQAYGMGSWRCAPDEAAVLELDPPGCRMWGLSLCDRWWQSIDFARRQSSLNSCQAALRDDGAFRAVICHDDPGVANWLDPGGSTEGTLALRYLFPDSVPPLRYRTVGRDDVGDIFAGDPTTSPAERADSLQRRRRAVTRRSWC